MRLQKVVMSRVSVLRVFVLRFRNGTFPPSSLEIPTQRRTDAVFERVYPLAFGLDDSLDILLAVWDMRAHDCRIRASNFDARRMSFQSITQNLI